MYRFGIPLTITSLFPATENLEQEVVRQVEPTDSRNPFPPRLENCFQIPPKPKDCGLE